MAEDRTGETYRAIDEIVRKARHAGRRARKLERKRRERDEYKSKQARGRR